MSIEYASSDISIVCQCPYAGKTREIKGSAESEDKRRRKLKNEIKQTKEDLTIARHVLVDTRRQLAAFQKILNLELGWTINPYIRNESSWKERVREEAYLKFELVRLVDYLRESDHRYVNDPDAYPTKLSTSTEDLLLARQEMKLKDLYHNYTVYLSENERRVGASLSNFLKLKENYENKLYCNKIMEQEIVSVKKRISDLQRQFLEDKCLIDYITEHHFKMKGTFLDVNPGEKVPDSGSQKVNGGDTEAEKFKKMWEQSRMEKKKLAASLRILRERLEFANQKIVRAENICSGNIVTFRIIARKLKDSLYLAKMQPKRKDEFGKFSLIQYRSQTSQLEAAVNENQYLRNFLRKAVLSKTDHLKQFQNSLRSTAEKYRAVLEDIRNKLAPPPPPPVAEETKVTKKKAK